MRALTFITFNRREILTTTQLRCESGGEHIVLQSLTVVLSSELDCSNVRLIPNATEPSAIGVKSFSAEQEWKLANDVTVWNSTQMRTNNDKKARFPVMSVAATVSRRPQFFIWNIITMMVSGYGN